MKNLVAVVTMLAIAVMFSACATFQAEKPLVQTAPCVVSIEEVAEVPACTKVKIKEAVMFDWDKSVIRADQNELLDKIAKLMADCSETTLVLDGYASLEGPEKYNLALSQRRADAVKAALIEKGVAADRIVNAVGNGEVGIFGELLKLNRRVVVLSVD